MHQPDVTRHLKEKEKKETSRIDDRLAFRLAVKVFN